jgi:hypothetical protein
MTVGVYGRADMKIHYVEIGGLHVTTSLQLQRCKISSTRMVDGGLLMSADGSTRMFDSDIERW